MWLSSGAAVVKCCTSTILSLHLRKYSVLANRCMNPLQSSLYFICIKRIKKVCSTCVWIGFGEVFHVLATNSILHDRRQKITFDMGLCTRSTPGSSAMSQWWKRGPCESLSVDLRRERGANGERRRYHITVVADAWPLKTSFARKVPRKHLSSVRCVFGWGSNTARLILTVPKCIKMPLMPRSFPKNAAVP